MKTEILSYGGDESATNENRSFEDDNAELDFDRCHMIVASAINRFQ